MAQREIDATFAGLVFRPDNGGIPRIPSQLLKQAQNDALGDRLLIGKSPLAQSFCNIGKSDLECHNAQLVFVGTPLLIRAAAMVHEMPGSSVACPFRLLACDSPNWQPLSPPWPKKHNKVSNCEAKLS
jgi:hypothetical protein